MLTLMYYVFIWPFRVLGKSLIDDLLVIAKLKWRPAYGDPIWYKRPIRDWWKRRRQVQEREREHELARARARLRR